MCPLSQCFFRCALLTVGVLGFAVGAEANSRFVNYESGQVHPIDMNPSADRLAVCNTAAGRADVYNVSTGVPQFLGSVSVGVDPVSVRWRDDSEFWVVNIISDSVTIVDAATLTVKTVLQTDDEPCDVVFAGDPLKAFVSCSQVNRVLAYDLANLATAPTAIDILGEDPRAMAVSPDGSTVYVAVFESGNHTTILGGGNDVPENVLSFPPDVVTHPVGPYGGLNPPPNAGLGFFPPLNENNPPAPGVSLIVKKQSDGRWLDDNDGDWTSFVSGENAFMSGRHQGWDMLDNDVAIIDANGLAVSGYLTDLMNMCMAIAVNPSSGAISVVGTEAINQVRFEPNVNGRFVHVEVALNTPGVDLPDGSTIVDLNAAHLAAAQPGGTDPYETPTVPQSERDKSIGDPRGIVWNSAGTRGYITGMGSNNLVIINALGQRTALGATVELGAGPTGLVLDEGRQRLYVLNRFSGSISVVSTNEKKAVSEIARVPYFDPTPQAIRIGRKHLYDTHKNSGLGQAACASCHIDGKMDRLAWDLGDPSGEMKLLDETTLLGEGVHNLGFNLPALSRNPDLVGLIGPLSPEFTDFHPMKGPMTTQTLQDIIGHEPLHWRGDRDGIEQFNGAFNSLQGDDENLSEQEMQEFENFLHSMVMPPNPYRNFDNSLPTDLALDRQYKSGRFGGEGEPLPNGNAQRGMQLYTKGTSLFGAFGFPGLTPPIDQGTFSCVTCHTLPVGAGTDSIFNFTLFNPEAPNPADLFFFEFIPIQPGPKGEHHHALVSVDGSKQKAIKIPQLRNQFDKTGFEMTQGNISYSGFGYVHDGCVDSLARFISEPAFDVNSDQDVADIVALVLAFSGSDFPEPTPELLNGVFPVAVFPPGSFSQDSHAAVGKQAIVAAGAKNGDRIGSMIAIADAGKIDVMATTTIEETSRNYLYTGDDAFQGDSAFETATLAELTSVVDGDAARIFTALNRGTGLRIAIDTDEDGLKNYDEVRDYNAAQPGVQNPLDPTRADASGDDLSLGPDGIADIENDWDGDGISNGVEINEIGSNPTTGDSDDDGISDSDEGAEDSDNDGLPNSVDDDSDNDGIADVAEGGGDYDNDHTPNYLDLDSDNGGLSDADELAAGKNPLNPNDDFGAGATDINDDNSVDAVDIQLVINAVLGLDIGGLDADVNASGGLPDAVDVQLIINAVLNITK